MLKSAVKIRKILINIGKIKVKDKIEADESLGQEELKELALEALEEEGKSTKLPEGKIMTFGIIFDVPEGFVPDQEYENTYVTDRYPIEASNVRYYESDIDYTLQLVDKSDFKQLIEQTLSAANGKEIEVNITEFTELDIDKIPSIRIKLKYSLDDVNMENLIYIINGSKTYMVIYTQTDEYDRMSLFEESAKTIRVKK